MLTYFEDDRTFDNAPFFDRAGAALGFGMDSVDDAGGYYGAVFVLR